MNAEDTLWSTLADGTRVRGPQRLGLYRIFWKTGGSSLAAVGMGNDGTRWLAPTNWVAPSADPSKTWDLVEYAIFLKDDTDADSEVASMARLEMLRAVTDAWMQAHKEAGSRAGPFDSFVVGYMQAKLQQIAAEEGEKP